MLVFFHGVCGQRDDGTPVSMIAQRLGGGRAIHLGSYTTLAVERGNAGRPLDVAATATRVALAVPERQVVLNVEVPGSD